MVHVITGRNVNGVYRQAVQLVRSRGVLQSSRAGDVLAVPEPVVLVTKRPQERVLLDPQRDANCFFHLMECLWLVAGRNDAAFLNRFVRDFGERFAESDGHLHGAYGHRWRNHFEDDQLDTVVRMMRADPTTRRVVIQMWDPDADLLDPMEINDETGVPFDVPKDLPCNTQILPRIVDGRLDLMVVCRSNDVVWGATGANSVHFSFLLEYLAGRIGCQVGVLRQCTTNLHGYTSVLAKVGEPGETDPYDPVECQILGDHGPVSSTPIGTDWEHWDEDLLVFLRWIEVGDEPMGPFHNHWFSEVAWYMWECHWEYKRQNYVEAMAAAKHVAAPDWSLAAQQWLQRRIDKRAKIVEVRAG